MPEPGPGEVLVRVLWTSVDPYQRGRMSEARSYAKPVQVGEVMTAQSLGEVVESEDGGSRPATSWSVSSAGRSTPSPEAGRCGRSGRRSTRRRSRCTSSARPA